MAIKKVIELDVNTENAVKGVDDLAEALGSVNTEIKDVEDNSDNSLKGIQDNSKKATKGVQNVSKSFRGLGLAIKALGIGLVLKAFDTLYTLFSQNQRVVDFFSTSFNFVSIAFQDFTEFVFNNFNKIGEFFRSVFSVEGLQNFGQAIIDNVVERFKSLLDTVSLVGSAFSEFFRGNFAEAGVLAREAGKEFVDILTGVDNSVEKATQSFQAVQDAVINYATSTAKAAQATTDLANQSQIALAVNQGLIEKYDRQAEQLRQIRDDESLTIEERIAANEELGRVLDEQEEVMLKNAQISVDAAQANLELADTTENQVALIEAQNEALAIQAQVEGYRSEQLINVNSLLREQTELEKERIENQKEAAEEEIKIAEEKAKELEEEERRSAEERKKIEEDLQSARAKSIEQSFAILETLLGKGSAEAKAASIAQATINTYQGISEVWSKKTESPFLGASIAQKVIASAFVAAQGFAAVKGIAGTQVKGGSSGGGSVPSSSSLGLTEATPNFNVVGQSETNQLAQTVAQQNTNQQPIRAYVVSSEVTTQQSLDRNIINTASFG